MKTTLTRIALAACLVLLTAGVAQAQTSITPSDTGTQTQCNDCGGTYREAVTNGVPTTINNPKNSGGEDACSFTLECRDAQGNKVGLGQTYAPGQNNHSFSCGANAAQIVRVCHDDGTECKFSYTKAAKVDVTAKGPLGELGRSSDEPHLGGSSPLFH